MGRDSVTLREFDLCHSTWGGEIDRHSRRVYACDRWLYIYIKCVSNFDTWCKAAFYAELFRAK